MTPANLAAATGASIGRASAWLTHIEAAMDEFEINTPKRQAAFLAQVGHESGGLRWVAEIWGPTDAQKKYDGRVDLGNTRPGDGLRYKGRGLLQITGRANYRAAGGALGVDLIEHPEQLETPTLAARSAALFWQSHQLNELADVADFKRITRIINGGYNGYESRLANYQAALQVLA